jgi:hypothetical protein
MPPHKNIMTILSSLQHMRAPIRSALSALTLSLVMVPLFASARTLQPYPVDAFRPVLVNGEHAAVTRAAWNLSGYGTLYNVHRQGADVDVYNYAGDRCWRDPLASGSEANNLIAWYALSWRDFDLAFATTPDGPQYHAEWFPFVPSQCTRAANRTTPIYTFDAITSSLVELYPYGAERHIDWAERNARLRPRAMAAHTDGELKDVLAELMDGLEDPHTGINGVADGEYFEIGSKTGKPTFHRLQSEFSEQTEYTDFFSWLIAWKAADDEKVLALLTPASRKHALNDALMWGVLDESNVGYLSIGQMMGYEAGADLARERELIGQTIDEALHDLQGTDALVVDIATNLGGYAQVASDIAARFADQRRLAYTTHAPGAHGVAPQPYYVSPAGQSHYGKPVMLLTSDMTVSAGEKFVLLMRGLPNVVHVGQTTQGALGGGLGKGLPNGWEFGMPNEIVRDAQGVVHEAAGIAPTIGFEVFPADNFESGHVQAVLRTAQVTSARELGASSSIRAVDTSRSAGIFPLQHQR